MARRAPVVTLDTTQKAKVSVEAFGHGVSRPPTSTGEWFPSMRPTVPTPALRWRCDNPKVASVEPHEDGVFIIARRPGTCLVTSTCLLMGARKQQSIRVKVVRARGGKHGSR